MSRDNFWRNMIRFINYRGVNTTLTRRSLVRLYYGYIPTKCRGLKTFDEYRRLLQNNGYLERAGRGQYLITKQIPDYLTLKEARAIDRRPLSYDFIDEGTNW